MSQRIDRFGDSFLKMLKIIKHNITIHLFVLTSVTNRQQMLHFPWHGTVLRFTSNNLFKSQLYKGNHWAVFYGIILVYSNCLLLFVCLIVQFCFSFFKCMLIINLIFFLASRWQTEMGKELFDGSLRKQPRTRIWT